MIANSRCIACNLSKKEEKIRKHSDEKKRQKITGFYIKWGNRIKPMIKVIRTFIMNIMKRLMI